MTTAFVLSGGASHGATHVGMLMALADADITPDLLVGTSSGALNAAWLACNSNKPLDQLATVWRGLSRKRVFPAELVGGFLGFTGRRNSLFTNRSIRQLVQRQIQTRQIEGSQIPLHVIATDIRTGEELRLSEGPLIDAVMASAALPGLLPPVPWQGRMLVDGGLRNNTPISHAVDLGADEIYVLATGYSCQMAEPPTTAIGVALQAIGLLISQRLERDVSEFSETATLHIPPGMCVDVGPTDFAQADRLIDGAYANTTGWIAGGCAPVDPASLHHVH